MAQPIRDNPVIRGRAAKQFRRMFLSKSDPSKETVERNKKDVELFLNTPAYDMDGKRIIW